MFQDTRPADIDKQGSGVEWDPFRLAHEPERLALLRQLRDQSVPVMLNAADGAVLSSQVWSVDAQQQRLAFRVATGSLHAERFVETDEAVAVAYLDNVKLQFDLGGFLLVRGAGSEALQCAMPTSMFRFQRRGAYRVRPAGRAVPQARLRHPAIADMTLVLRVVDVSVGGCALWLPADVPPLEAGTVLGEMALELDSDTRLTTSAVLQHVTCTTSTAGAGGARLGCEWPPLDGLRARTLQRWIDRAQQRHRLLRPR